MSVSVFAERLRNAMNSRGLKQVDLVHAAEHRGVKMGKSHISQYVAGKTMPREDVLEFLASELDVDTNWLRGEESTTQLNSDASNSVTDGEHAATPLAMGAAKPQTDSEIPVGRRRTFGKSHKLDNVLYDVRGPVADEAMRMEANGTHILKLNIGNPAPFGFRTPDEVVYDMAHQLTDTEGYSPSKGLFSARKAIMQYAQLKNIPNVTIDDIYTGNGVSELINLSMSALLDTGDEVLVPSPDYPLWTACVNLAGGTAVHYLCDEQSEWYPDIDDIRSKITSNTKAIVIINPNNPTGALYPKEVLQQIVDIAREHQLIIFSDEIYDRLVMDGLQHISIASMAPDLFCVTFSGLSKSHMIAGYRIGWMILSGNKRIAKDYIEGLNMLANMRMCSNVPAQSVVQTALGGHQSVNDYIVPGGRVQTSATSSTTCSTRSPASPPSSRRPRSTSSRRSTSNASTSTRTSSSRSTCCMTSTSSSATAARSTGIVPTTSAWCTCRAWACCAKPWGRSPTSSATTGRADPWRKRTRSIVS